MKLSAPIFELKRRARRMARNKAIPLHEALDRIARDEGFARWSLLSSRIGAESLSRTVLDRLDHGDMLLIAGRPGHGKTTHALQLLIDAACDNREARLFTLELTAQQARKHIASLAGGKTETSDRIRIDTSDAISADYIVQSMSEARPGTVAVIDFLQLLDQQRSKPVLAEQIETLSAFARRSGVILGFISQIDRSFDPETRSLPDIRDIRLPNVVALDRFNKACFLHAGEAQLQNLH